MSSVPTPPDEQAWDLVDRDVALNVIIGLLIGTGRDGQSAREVAEDLLSSAEKLAPPVGLRGRA